MTVDTENRGTVTPDVLRAIVQDAAEAAKAESVTPQDVLRSIFKMDAPPVGENEAFYLAAKAFAARTGRAPSPTQAETLLQQVKAGFIDGKPANISRTEPLDLGPKIPAAQERRARAEAAAARMDGLTIPEAAKLAGISERAMRARVDRGSVRSWKGPDRKRRIPRQDLEAAGLIQAPLVGDMPDFAALENTPSGSGRGSATDAANAVVPELSSLAMKFWDKAEQAVKEATEQRMLTQFAETRVQEAQLAAERMEKALHEARAETAAARAEADLLRQRLGDASTVEAGNTSTNAENVVKRHWWSRRTR